MLDGEQRKVYESIGVQVQVYPFFWYNKDYMQFIEDAFDFIIVNTIVLKDLVATLNGRNKQ